MRGRSSRQRAGLLTVAISCLLLSTPAFAAPDGFFSPLRWCAHWVYASFARWWEGEGSWDIRHWHYEGQKVSYRSLPRPSDNMNWITDAGLRTRDGVLIKMHYAGYAWNPGYLWYLANRYPDYYGRYGIHATMPAVNVFFWSAWGLNKHLNRVKNKANATLPFRFVDNSHGATRDFGEPPIRFQRRGLQEGCIVLGGDGEAFEYDRHYLLPGAYLLTPNIFEAFRWELVRIQSIEAALLAADPTPEIRHAIEFGILTPFRAERVERFRQLVPELAPAVLFENWEEVKRVYGALTVGTEEAVMAEVERLLTNTFSNADGTVAYWQEIAQRAVERASTSRRPIVRADRELEVLRARLGVASEIEEPSYARRVYRPARYPSPIRP